MSWIIDIFCANLVNTVTGTSAFILLRILMAAAKRKGAVYAVYPLYKIVQVFYIVPALICMGSDRFRQMETMFAEREIFSAIAVGGSAVWLTGVLTACILYLRTYRQCLEMRRCSIPFQDRRYTDILRACYPDRDWSRIPMRTNFLLGSPCVFGVLCPELLFPEADYTEAELKAILAHEATHIVKHDNLWKMTGVAVMILNWYNPVLFRYMDGMDEWADTACDIFVCRNFYGGYTKEYFMILYRLWMKGKEIPLLASAAQSGSRMLKRRVERILMWNKK